MGGPLNARNALLGAAIGIVVYIALLASLSFLLRSVSLNVAALITLLVMLGYPAALVLGAVLSLRRQRRRRERGGGTRR